MKRLPITVLIPTRNCASLVPGHLATLDPWIDLAEEVLVVDSESRDGTVAMLEKGLKHPQVVFLRHPPGLYQSWNHGISKARTPWTYLSTVGDAITRAGIEELHAVGEKFSADVVISKPRFIDEGGRELPDQKWPIDDILNRLRIEEPLVLTQEEQFFFAMINTWGAILGSSASNLYRTKCLQEKPFPTEFGTAGDGGWGVMHALDVSMAVTPHRFSTFRYHEKAYKKEDYHVDSLALKLFRVARQTLATRVAADPRLRAKLEELRLLELEETIHRHLTQQGILEDYREKFLPWSLHPGAWVARKKRTDEQRKMDAIAEDVAARFRRERQAVRSSR